jgi:hypothetical protein
MCARAKGADHPDISSVVTIPVRTGHRHLSITSCVWLVKLLHGTQFTTTTWWGWNPVYINFKTNALYLEGDSATRAFYGIPELGTFSAQSFAPPSFDHPPVHRETRRLSYGFEGTDRGVIGYTSVTTRWYLTFFENLETMYFHDAFSLKTSKRAQNAI